MTLCGYKLGVYQSIKLSLSFPMAPVPSAHSDLEKQRDYQAEVVITEVTYDHPRVSMGARTLSINSVHDSISPGAARIPVEFRTLSVDVESFKDKSSDSSPQPAHIKGNNKAKAEVKEIATLDWHTISVAEVLERLSTSAKVGLDDTQASRRLSTYGPNRIKPPPSNILRKLAGWIFGGFGTLLLGAAIICFISWKPLGNPPEASNLALAVVLLIVLFLQAIFNAWQDFSTSRVMKSIQTLLPAAVTVIRNDFQTTIPADKLVPGDLVVIAMGMKIPADLRLTQCTGDCTFDRSILTGESEPIAGAVDKTSNNFLETKNIALQGTHCVSGSGQGIVIQTGDSTVFGRIAGLSAKSSNSMTTLQREILRLVVIIASMAVSVAILLVILWAAWLRREFPTYINVPNLLIDIVSVMVAFIPEGLPVAVTISLAKVAGTLSKHKVLCKSLSIVETLGAVNVICSDKTGTLTQNKMHVENVAVYDTEFKSSVFRDKLLNKSISKEHETPQTSSDNVSEVSRENLIQVAAVAGICNAAVFTEDKETGIPEILGDATDAALLSFSNDITPVKDLGNIWQEVHKINFNSKTKFMLKLSRLSTGSPSGHRPAPLASWDDFMPTDYLLTIKGAPDVLFPRCSFIANPNGGQPLPLNEKSLARIVRKQEEWASQGQRVLVLARKIIKEEDIPKSALKSLQTMDELMNDLNEDLIIVGLVALMDPLKDDIIETVRTCRGAGIRFFVVTGDHPATAVAIAAQAGIVSNPSKIHHLSDLDPNYPLEKIQPYVPVTEDDPDPRPMRSIVITGNDMTQFQGTQLTQLCNYDEIVFARTTPEQKLFIVRAFQEGKCIVGMTGDGVNDSASLKAADIGIAMGSGSDIAREAADMVLLDNFGSIVIALEYGRLVYDNLKKTCLYLLPAGSFSELMPVLLNIFLGVPQMLSNIQMIIICVVTDVGPALSLCMEPPESGLLRRRPRNTKTDRMVNLKLLIQAYGFLGVLESLCAMSLSFWYLQKNGVPFSELVFKFGNWPTLTPELLNRAQSVYFFTLVIMQWGNLLATRGRKLSIFQHTPALNYYLFPAMGLALCLAVFFSYVPFFQKIFLTRGIPAENYFIPITFGIGLLTLDEVRKFFVRRYPKGFLARIAW